MATVASETIQSTLRRCSGPAQGDEVVMELPSGECPEVFGGWWQSILRATCAGSHRVFAQCCAGV
ncbi:hypothetical protein GCM10009624_25060 [Gordonia sinesedis]